MQIEEAKNRLRAALRERRRAVDADGFAAISEAISGAMLTLPEIAAAKAVHTFISAARLQELDLDPFIEAVHARGVKVLVPIVKRYSREWNQERLAHSYYRPGMELSENRWGILEPVRPEPAQLTVADVIVVPALGCDLQGNRVGSGYGFYDQLLTDARALSVCPCMDATLVQEIPTEEHDRPVDIIVTETRILRPGDRDSV